MAEPEDLLGKADALMARHRPGRTGSESYPEIPVLEEVVDFPPESDNLPVLTELVELELVEPELVEPELVEPEPVEPELVDSQLLRQEQYDELAASLQASLLAALQPEIDSLIEERLKESIEPLVERLFNDLRGDLQLIARATLSDAIKLAVERELERRKSGD